MPQYIDIKDFIGVFTNADMEDIPREFAGKLINLRPINGKLDKTFGLGTLINTAFINNEDYTTRNIFTYIQEKLTSPTGYRIILVEINDISGLVNVKYWNGSAWTAWITGGYYHNKARNPIIADGGILRFLPGNKGEISSNECKGIWVGYIDREYFFGLYTPSAGFYETTLIPEYPSTWTYDTIEEHGSGALVKGYHYYKYVPIFDGLNEPLLSSNYFKFQLTNDNKTIKQTFKLNTNDFNKRITAIKVYRSFSDEASGDLAPVYYHCKTIPLNTKSSHTDKKAQQTGVNSGKCLYEPGYDFSALVFNYNAVLRINSNDYDIDSLYNEYIILTSDLATGDSLWGGSYEIWDKGLSDTLKYSGSNGYCGRNTLFKYSWSWAGDELNNWVAVITGGSDCVIVDTIDRIIKLNQVGGINGTSLTVDIYNGYYFAYSAPNLTLYVYDYGFAEGSRHPLESEKFIKVNGKFARIIRGRLLQFNVVLDPGGENEERPDVLSYSEYNQYDVNPVSNIRLYPDREGGGGTGLAEIFGRAVIMKKQALFLMNMVNPIDPTTWVESESIHNIGNIAPEGYVEVAGAVYVCYYDGIYKLYPNNLAETDATPTERLKITDPIQDVYDGIDDKTAIETIYDQYLNEIVFKWVRNSTQEVWHYNPQKETWRQTNTGVSIGMMTYDQDARVIAYDSSDKKIKSFAIDEAVGIIYKSKRFPVSMERKELVRFADIYYETGEALTVNVYLDGEVSPTFTFTLPAGSNVIERVPIRERCNAFEIELTTTGSSNSFKLNRIKIELD